MSKKYPFYRQFDAMDCGAACVRMVARYHGRIYSLEYLRELCHVDKDGVSLYAIADAAEYLGFQTIGVKLPYERLRTEVPLPAIAHWKQEHFVVVYKVTKKHVWVADPAAKIIKYTKQEFLEGWDIGEQSGVLLLLEPKADFYNRDKEKINRRGFKYLFPYLLKYKGLIFQIILGVIIAGLLQLAFPFLTQSIVDIGIENQDIGFINIILLAQLMLFFSKNAIDFVRSWILLHVGSRANINIISDFLLKMVRLPITFFDKRMKGDILQRINDHQRVELFLASSSLVTLFSLSTFLVFGTVLLFYNKIIFLVFLIAALLYLAWILFFLRKRRTLDFKRFDKLSSNQNNLIEIIDGIADIKLHGAEKQKRWAWERTQASLFRVNISNLALEQWQEAGGIFINELKNIIITILAAKAVISGSMTLGEMLAIQYMLGQLNAPLDDMVNFVKVGQDAKISLERLAEIHDNENEEVLEDKINILPEMGNLVLDEVSFRYGGPEMPLALKDLSFVIPKGKTTAIVGTSGSGKTTLLKLLLNFYQPTSGVLRLGDTQLSNIKNKLWRDECGVIMQDGYLFTDTIARNIALGEEIVDKRKLLHSVKVANIQTFIESLPLSYNTKIGNDGIGLSQGQRQRILIARAVYKQPNYIFFDEATNALDAYNEMVIMNNLYDYFLGKTIVIVAHRLSTVKNADNIIVLEAGEVIEQGTHRELVMKQGAYYQLIKNQLELGG